MYKIEGDYHKTTLQKITFFEIFDPEWTVVGGGAWKIDEGIKELTLSGESQAYGKFDPRGLKKKLILTENRADCKILIDVS